MQTATALIGIDEREDSIRMITESASAVLKEDLARARRLRFSEFGFDRAKLGEFGELGWMMARVPEINGGLGLGLSELCALARQLGRRLTPEPIIPIAVLAPVLPADIRDASTRGASIVLPAFVAYGSIPPRLEAGHLTGAAEAVPLALSADAFVVQTQDGAALVRKSVAGLHAEHRPTHDGGHLSFLSFTEAEATPISCNSEALRDEAALGLSAYLLGLSESAFDLTNGYLKDREQFGRPIGSFQSLQHRMVDLYLEISLLTAAVETAAEQWDRGATADERARFVSVAKARASKTTHSVTQASIQLHGGIGYSDEADIGLFLRKAMTLAGLLGTERFHRHRAFRLLGSEA